MLDGARSKVKSGLAAMSFFMALSGGILASVSKIGGWLGNIADIGPWYTPPILFAITFVICLGDWAEDSIPNRRAVYTAMVFPSFLVGSLTGECGAKLFRAIGAISKPTAQAMTSGVKNWTQLPGELENAFTLFSFILIVGAATYAQQYAARKRKAAAASSGTAQPVAARRAGR